MLTIEGRGSEELRRELGCRRVPVVGMNLLIRLGPKGELFLNEYLKEEVQESTTKSKTTN